MKIFNFNRVSGSTKFSEFIRNASSREKKRVFADVLVKATERQTRILEEVKASA